MNQATPTITWATPAAITYGTALSATQLNATSSVPGTLPTRRPAGTVLPPAPQTLGYLHADGHDRLHHGNHNRLVDGNQATPTITWATPAAITYGTALSGTQLNATGQRAGNFGLYACRGNGADRRTTDPLGDLYADRHDRLHHGDGNRALTVNQATPTITWADAGGHHLRHGAERQRS